MANQMPDTLINYEIYYEGTRFLGTADVELPNLNAMTTEVKGSGIFGVIDKTVLAQFQAMSVALTWRAIMEVQKVLMAPRTHHLEAWGAVQHNDGDDARFAVRQHKVIMKTEPKNLTIGKFGVAEPENRKWESEVVYFREQIDGVDMIEIDKYNQVFRVGDTDYSAPIRAALGL